MAINILRPKTRSHTPEDGIARRLLDSSAQLSYDPLTEVDWETPSTRDSTARARSGAPSTGRRTGTR